MPATSACFLATADRTALRRLKRGFRPLQLDQGDAAAAPVDQPGVGRGGGACGGPADAPAGAERGSRKGRADAFVAPSARRYERCGANFGGPLPANASSAPPMPLDAGKARRIFLNKAW